MTETWLPVVGFEGLYEVSDLGSVRSLRRRTPAGMRGGKLLKASSDPNGYQHVGLYRDGRGTTIRVHRLVLEAFVGPCPVGMEARHFPDPDKRNNALVNLGWTTSSTNNLDQVIHGTHPHARKDCCPDCGGEYILNSQGGRICEPCQKEKKRVRWQENAEETSVRRRDRYQRDRDIIRPRANALQREARERDPEKVRSYHRDYYARNREHLLEQRKARKEAREAQE